MPIGLSVAMSTYNAAPFLKAQLDSVLGQSRLPDELVVGDDASTDGTVAILEAFVASAPFPVTILRQPQNVGVAANYTAVIAACRGDIIACCDHDDIWEPNRLARGLAAMADPRISMAFSDASLMDAEGRMKRGTLWGTLGFTSDDLKRLATPAAFGFLLARRAATGGTMTLRAAAARWALPIPAGWYQDEWLAQMAALHGRVQPIAEPLMRYRQHARNAVGARPDGLAARMVRSRDGGRRARLEAHLAQLRVLLREMETKTEVPDAALEAVRGRIRHVEARLRVEGNPLRRAQLVWAELRTGGYAHDAMGRWSALQDLVG